MAAQGQTWPSNDRSANDCSRAASGSRFRSDALPLSAGSGPPGTATVLDRLRIGECGRSGRLERPVAVDRHAVHYPPLALIVVERIVLHAPIIPKRDRTLLPPEAAGKFRPDRVLP